MSSELERIKAENAELSARLTDLQQRLMQAEKLSSVGALASSITHEFNNILTTVINYAKMGLRHKQAAIRDKAFDRILASGQRAAKITTGLLSYARNRSERKDALSLRQVVHDVLVLVEKDLQVHRVRLETRFHGEPYALVNAGQLQQVLLNLIINARQAMEQGGVLYVSVGPSATEPDVVEISIRDTGCGIPADRLPRIFDRFYTTKTADDQGQGGTGLGLALCKDVIDSHQGRIRVESVIGKGTAFTLKLPSIPAPAAAAATRSTAAPAAVSPVAQRAG
ncbi:MAG: sensor histidine kinase [Planctomyces sp.]|nr:sensor histidine kinase [Planctomyces sp.]